MFTLHPTRLSNISATNTGIRHPCGLTENQAIAGLETRIDGSAHARRFYKHCLRLKIPPSGNNHPKNQKPRDPEGDTAGRTFAFKPTCLQSDYQTDNRFATTLLDRFIQPFGGGHVGYVSDRSSFVRIAHTTQGCKRFFRFFRPNADACGTGFEAARTAQA